MSSSSPEKISPEILTRVTREERLLLCFDFYNRQGGPIGVLWFCVLKDLV
jgi:hypothetical protein